MKRSLLFYLLLLSSIFHVNGQIANWSFDDDGSGTDNVSPTIVTADASATDVITVGAIQKAFVNGNPGKAHNSRAWNGNTGGSYIEVCVTPSANHSLSISALNFDTKASGTGPSSLEVRLIIDGNTESIGTATTTSSFKGVAFVPNQIPTVTSSTACFRIIATGASSSTGTLQIDNLNVEGSVLPIELNYFRATTEEDIVNVLWQTATETNNDYMEVQRSRDGQNFAAIGTVTGAGTTSEVQDYSFTDNDPLAGVSYYRLQQFDYDGASEIHQTITVYRSTTDWNIQTAPSAVTQQLSIFSSEVLETPATYEIFTMDGRLVQRGVMQENTATMRLDVSQLAKGNHILVMKTTSNSTVTRFSKL